MFKNCYHDPKLNRIHLKEIGSDKFVEYDFEHTYWVKDKTGNSKIKDIHGNSMVKMVAESSKNLDSLKASGAYLCESDLDERTKFLQNRYGSLENLKPNPSDFNTCFMDIEVAGSSTFDLNHEIKIRKKH